MLTKPSWQKFTVPSILWQDSGVDKAPVCLSAAILKPSVTEQAKLFPCLAWPLVVYSTWSTGLSNVWLVFPLVSGQKSSLSLLFGWFWFFETESQVLGRPQTWFIAANDLELVLLRTEYCDDSCVSMSCLCSAEGWVQGLCMLGKHSHISSLFYFYFNHYHYYYFETVLFI